MVNLWVLWGSQHNAERITRCVQEEFATRSNSQSSQSSTEGAAGSTSTFWQEHRTRNNNHCSCSEFAAQRNGRDFDLCSFAHLWMLLSSGEGFLQIIVRAVGEVCVQLLFDVLPWAVFRILPSALPPALMCRGDGGQCPPGSQSMHRDPDKGDSTTLASPST